MSTKSEYERKKSIKKVTSSDNILDPGQKVNPFKNMNSLFGKISNEEDDDGYPTVEEWLKLPDNEKINVLHDSLLELYLNVKIRNFDKTIDSEKVDEELDKLK